jgi:hypothetical protein
VLVARSFKAVDCDTDSDLYESVSYMPLSQFGTPRHVQAVHEWTSIIIFNFHCGVEMLALSALCSVFFINSIGIVAGVRRQRVALSVGPN